MSGAAVFHREGDCGGSGGQKESPNTALGTRSIHELAQEQETIMDTQVI